MEDKIFKTSLAKENWESKYKYGNETPLETQIRVAKALASIEEKKEYWEDKFLKTLVKFDENGDAIGLKCTPGGRITANAGTDYKNATLFNCFINGPVKKASLNYVREIPGTDEKINCSLTSSETPDNLMNIFLTILEQAETLKSEGGYGINFDFIRPRGTIIKGVGVKHPGIVEYMKVWDQVATCIVKGDNDGYKDTLKNYLDDNQIDQIKKKIKAMPRKGAMMGVLSIWHPDIEEFVRAKQTPGTLTKFNISVLVDDKFMKAVEENDFYELKFNGEVHKKVKAKELYELIMKSTYNRAEPGILFYDAMQKNNPISYLGDNNATNPCGEISGNPITSTTCLLGSINLTQYVDKNRQFDFETYIEDVKVFARMLDNVNDLSSLPLPQYHWAVKNIRQYGMGLNGLGSALYMMGVKYNSQEALDFVKKLLILRENHTWQTSALLAKEKGKFPMYNKKEFLNTDFYKQADYLWDETKQLIEKHGVRNAKTSTNPPLGNTSVICDMVSNGLEPIFMNEYERTIITHIWPEGLNTENVKDKLKPIKAGDADCWKGEYTGKIYYFEPHNRGLCIIEPVRDYGYQWVMDNFPQDIKNGEKYLITTEKLEVEDHLNIQELFQKYCNQSVSKTVNLPNDYSFKKFKELYFDGWKKGLIGLTTYRDGSMEAVLSKVEEAKDEERVVVESIKLPDELVNGNLYKIKKEGSKFYLHFSYLPDDSNKIWPVALFITTNNPGYDSIVCNRAAKMLKQLALDQGIPELIVEKQFDKTKDDLPHMKISKMISLNLRHNVKIIDIISSLKEIEGDNISSLLTAIRKFLAKHVKNGEIDEKTKCPKCNVKGKMVYGSGCTTCMECGFSGCN